MFKILQKTVTTGFATVAYPDTPAVISEHFRGRPQFELAAWTDARPAADVCPTGAISLRDRDGFRRVTIDYGLCVFCGQCADVSTDGAVRLTREFELATADRRSLILQGDYSLNDEGGHDHLMAKPFGDRQSRAGRRPWHEGWRSHPQALRPLARHPRSGCRLGQRM